MARYKFDENIDTEVAEFLRTHGHDAVFVIEQRVAGTRGEILIERLLPIVSRNDLEGRICVLSDERIRFRHRAPT